MISDITAEILKSGGSHHTNKQFNFFWVEIELLLLDSIVFMLHVMAFKLRSYPKNFAALFRFARYS